MPRDSSLTDPAFVNRVRAVHGPAADGWLAELPATIERWSRAWSLDQLRPFPLSYHWVAAARRPDGTPCVLKLGVPGTEQPRVEAHWLGRVGGVGAAALLDADPAAGALLLERVEPGALLADRLPAGDDAACEVLAEVAARVRRPAEAGDLAAGLVPLADRVAELHCAASAALPAELLESARESAAELLRSAPPPVLLHGDLHHDNVLDGGARGWLAIDPHGVLGDPGYEFGAALYNPLQLGPAAAELAPRRVDRLAAASGLDAERIRGWGLVQAVLSAVWSLDEDPVPDEHVLAVARRLRG